VNTALRRWLTRPARVPAALRLTVAIVLGALAIVGFASPAPGQTTSSSVPASGPGGPRTDLPNPPSKSPEPPGAGNPTTSFASSPAMISEGHTLYESGCSSCHGIALNGIPGVAPSLRGVGAGPVDFYLSTGRMPLEQPHEEPLRNKPLYDRQKISDIVAFVASYGGPAAPATNPAKGDLALGLHQFTLNCAGCHQEVARGGIFVGGFAPNLSQATPLQIAEAVRMGPYMMPHFDAKQINQHELDSIVRYIQWTHHPQDSGGWGIYNIGPIPEGIVAWFVALASLVLIARLIGERAL
jgi:ubiquinol-cytochrome c reductase cytochrome c subunit